MTFITVNGTPDEMDEDQKGLESLMDDIVQTTGEASGIDYQREDIMVWFPPDRMRLGLGAEFSIDVAALDLSTDDRGDKGYDDVARNYCDIVAAHFPDFSRIKCVVRPFREHVGGYYDLRRDEPYPRIPDQ